MEDVYKKFSAHSQSDVYIFNLLSSHFTHVFFNDIYKTASRNTKDGASITETYSEHCSLFTTALKKEKKKLMKFIEDTYKQFIKWASKPEMKYDKFLLLIAAILIPKEKFQDCKESEKLEIVLITFADELAAFTSKCCDPSTIVNIVTNRDKNASKTIIELQEYGITAFLSTKTRIHSRFYNKTVQAKPVDDYSSESVNMLTAEISNLKDREEKLIILMRETNKKYTDIRHEVSKLRKENRDLKNELSQIEDVVDEPTYIQPTPIAPASSYAASSVGMEEPVASDEGTDTVTESDSNENSGVESDDDISSIITAD